MGDGVIEIPHSCPGDADGTTAVTLTQFSWKEVLCREWQEDVG